jgi:hypothetical protein
MPKLTIPAAGEAMPGATPTHIGRFSGRPIILGDIAVAAAAMQIDRDAASIAAALASIHGGKYRIQIDHAIGFVLVVQS